VSDPQAFEAWSWVATLGLGALALCVGGLVMRVIEWWRPPYPRGADDVHVDAHYHRCIVCGDVKSEDALEPALPCVGLHPDYIEWKCRGSACV
jgi:hypothetical protein